jgi:hypothetical protein
MAEAALKIEEPLREIAQMRRFEIADLTTHGPWLLKRFAIMFPGMSEQNIAGYLRGLIYGNEHIFWYQPHAVALAEFIHAPGLKMTRLVQERFVWCENKDDKDQLENAADFYIHMKRWAKSKDAERMIVCENSDVPKPLIEARLGRLFDTKITFARL